MPHQRGDHPGSFGSRGHALLRDGREAPPHSLHPAEFQRRRLAPMLVHHPSPGGRHVHGSFYSSPHPHSPVWYGSVAGSPHRVPGSSLSVASGESFAEERVAKKREEIEEEASKKAADDLREKHEIIHEALRRHMDDDKSIGTNEANAASALLFATAALRRAESSKVSISGSKEGDCQETEVLNTKKDEEGDAPGEEKEKEEPAESSGPLKKRRKMLEILREKPVPTTTAEKQPLHVSPLPSPQVRTRIASHEMEETTASATSPPGTASSSSTSMASPYDAKEAQGLHEGSKIKDAAEISPPPAQVMIKHFPTILHNVLTSSDFAESVVQWLPDGKAWKILRWDALRRKVLPKHFSELKDEEGRVGISIDAFLWHLAAWGFEEVQSGPDVGAYSHEFFRRNSPQLCHKMKFSPKQNELDSPSVPPRKTQSGISAKLKEGSQPHSILQVPSLASATSRSDEGGLKESEAALNWREEQRKNRAIHSPTIVYPSMPGRHARHPDTPVFVNYRMGDVAFAAEGWQYFPESPMAMRHIAPGLSSYEQQLIQQQNFEFSSPRVFALHSTPRVQSGRGALRHSSKVGLGKLERPAVRRSSFPVSNRGKVSRGGPGSRVVNPSAEILQSGSAGDTLSNQQTKVEESVGLQKTSEEVAERVAVAISKKTKRKLPLSSSSSSVATEQVEEKAAVKEGDNGCDNA